jgi:SAM-dependent methyltransferase
MPAAKRTTTPGQMRGPDSGATAYAAEVNAYFSACAAHYDKTDEQPFWRLSGMVLWGLLERDVLVHQPDDMTVLDAGAGTGRWSLQVLLARRASRAVLVDRSADMLAEARAKIRDRGFDERVRVVHGDLEDPAVLEGLGAADVVFCFHSVLGFVQDPARVAGLLAARLRAGGQLVLVVPSAYHMAYFALKRHLVDEAIGAVIDKKGRFADDRPAIHGFTPAQLVSLAQAAGLTDVRVRGFPCLLYPGEAETRGESTAGLVALLDDVEIMRRLVELEIRMALEPDTAARGNNLYVCATRP